MGKKKKNSSKKQLKKFMKSNRVMIAALTGAAAGIAIAGILGTEKAREIVSTVESSFRQMNTPEKREHKRSNQSPATRESKRETAATT